MARSRPVGENNEEIAERRRRTLIEAAFALVAEKGLEGLRTRDVAARAGVNISTLHYYFGTKDDLILALIDHVRHAFDAPARESGPVPESLSEHFALNGRIFAASPHLAAVLHELMSRAARDGAARKAFGSVIENWNGIVETILRHGIKTGRVRPDVDCHAAARACTSFVIGALTQLGVNAKAFDFARVAGAFEQCVAARPGESKKAKRK